MTPSFRSFHSSAFSLHQVESEGLHELSISGTFARAHPHTEPPREHAECRAVWLTCRHVFLLTASSLPQLMEQQLTTDKQSVTLLVAERAEAVCGDSAPLSLFSLPALILLKKKKLLRSLQGFLLRSSMMPVFLFSSSVTLCDIVQPLLFILVLSLPLSIPESCVRTLGLNQKPSPAVGLCEVAACLGRWRGGQAPACTCELWPRVFWHPLSRKGNAKTVRELLWETANGPLGPPDLHGSV